jgi:uncharacterized membrane protein
MADKTSSGGVVKSLFEELPVDRLKDEVRHGLTSVGEKAVSSAGERLTGLSDKLSDVADGGGFKGRVAKEGAKAAMQGESPIKGALKGGLVGAKDKVKEKLGGGGGGQKKATKATNIIEEIDVGLPVSVVYNQWTQFQDWSGFMKKVDGIEQEDEAKANFKAQVFWSHRRWEAHILEQVPDEKIVWRSKGDKGHVDGAVTFHEIAPNLTRVLVVLEYYPQGLFERTGNLWRAQGRRARLELKHFRRHAMTQVIQDPDSVEGWRGEIHEGEVERSHDEVVEEEQRQRDEAEEGYDEEQAPEDEQDADEYDEDEYDEDSAEDEYDEDEEPSEDEEEPEDEEYDEAEDEYDEEEPEEGEDEEYDDADEYEEAEDEEPLDEEGEDEEPEDEYDEDEYAEEDEEEEEEPAPRRRRRAS